MGQSPFPNSSLKIQGRQGLRGNRPDRIQNAREAREGTYKYAMVSSECSLRRLDPRSKVPRGVPLMTAHARRKAERDGVAADRYRGAGSALVCMLLLVGVPAGCDEGAQQKGAGGGGEHGVPRVRPRST